MSEIPVWRQRLEPQRFLLDLNIFIPLFVYGCLLLEASTELMGVDYFRTRTYAALAGVLVLLWAARGLAPAGVRPERVGRQRVGHLFLGAINGAVVATCVMPLVLGNLTGIEAFGHLMWIGIPVLIIAPWLWPAGLWMVWSSRGPYMPPKPSAAPARDAPWRVGHRGRDCMYYEELVAGQWERLEISGEMLMGEAHHVIYFDSAKAWEQYPAWARDRRSEIVGRIKQKFAAPDYEYSGA